MSTRVYSSVYCEPQSLPAVMDAIEADLESQGLTVSYGVGDTSGIFPHSIDAHWDVDGSQDPIAAVKGAVNRNSGLLMAWSDFSTDSSTQVLAPTLETLAADTKAAAKSALPAVTVLSTALALLAVAYLAFKFT